MGSHARSARSRDNRQSPGRASTALAQIRAVAERVARGYGLEIFDVQLRRESIGWVLRVIIDRPAAESVQAAAGAGAPRAAAALGWPAGSISVADCQRVSEDLSAILDAEVDFDHTYTLEVSSPGLDRPLRHLADCRRFVGRRVRIVTSEAVDGQHALVGRISGVEDDAVIVNSGTRVHRIPWTVVTRARLDVEF